MARRDQIKRQTDLQLISGWIAQGSRVLDLGCGRGVLLEHLVKTKRCRAVGVDLEPDKVRHAVARGVSTYQGDAMAFLREMPEASFDWVVISRTLQELTEPAAVIREALRVGRHLAVGFVNHGYWLNRWATLRTGSRPTNEVFPLHWQEGAPYNPVTVAGFQKFCAETGLRVEQRVFLRGDWRTPCGWLPNLRAGYAVYQVAAVQD